MVISMLMLIVTFVIVRFLGEYIRKRTQNGMLRSEHGVVIEIVTREIVKRKIWRMVLWKEKQMNAFEIETV